MLLPFVKEDSVLNSNPFMEHEVRFNLIHRISDDRKALLLHSEDNNIILGRSNPNFPMWVWVNPNTSIEVCNRALNEVKDLLKEEENFEIVSTPQFMKLFFDNCNCQYEKVMELESYLCNEVLMPKSTSGVTTLPSMDDLDIIAKFCVGFIYDGYGEEVSKESQLKGAKRMIKSGNLYVLKVNDKIVSMANIAHRAPRHGRINNVYTPPHERKKGYASQLVAHLSNLVLSEGLTPILFTDLTNKTSNKVYKGIGYVERGKVHHYRIMNIK